MNSLHTTTKSNPHSPQLERAQAQQQRPNASKNKEGKKFTKKKKNKKRPDGDFSGGPAVKISPSSAGGAGLIPGRGAKIPHVSQTRNRNIKQKQYWNKFNKDFLKNHTQRERHYQKRKLKANIFDKYRCKNSQLNIRKPNPTTHKRIIHHDEI